jgi:hypothetical protein
MKKFIFVAINPHKNQGHFESWRDFIKQAAPTGTFIFAEVSSIESLINDISLMKNKGIDFHVHLEWIHDFSINELKDFDQNAQKIGFTWSSHMAISQAVRNTKGSSKSEISKVYNSLKDFPNLKYIWTWDDEFHQYGLGHVSILSVPDRPNLATESMLCSLCTISKQDQGVKWMGLSGQIYGYRGADLVISLANEYPDQHFLLAGKMYFESLSAKSRRILAKSPKNLTVIDEYFPSDLELNHVIKHLSCLIIDTERYPEPSGIATRALAFGIPVLIHNKDSHLSYLSKKLLGIHFIYKTITGRNIVKWEEIQEPFLNEVMPDEMYSKAMKQVVIQTLGSTL